MRNGYVLAATAGALAVMSASGAQAQGWCGSAHHHDAVIECGYMTIADCKTAVGKGGICFVDPDLALNAARAKRQLPANIPALRLTVPDNRS